MGRKVFFFIPECIKIKYKHMNVNITFTDDTNYRIIRTHPSWTRWDTCLLGRFLILVECLDRFMGGGLVGVLPRRQSQ